MVVLYEGLLYHTRVLYTIPITPGLGYDLHALVVGFICSLFPFWTPLPYATIETNTNIDPNPVANNNNDNNAAAPPVL